ncbi:hypothetical protein Hanom_Chr05g00399061 [Helianthus anomalus]
MSHKGKALIYSVIITEELESFVSSYHIPSWLSPRLLGPAESATCSPECIVIYTLSFSFCGVRYPFIFQDGTTQVLWHPLFSGSSSCISEN